MIQRVIAYVDGFNLYFGMKSQGLRAGYWLDIPRLLVKYLMPGQQLVGTKYFTSRVAGSPEKARRQNVYLEALATRPGLSMHYGQYRAQRRRCGACGAEWTVPQEKMTDVNIATELLKDAFADRVDLALLASADSDLSGPIRAYRELWPSKRILALFPPGRGSVEIEALVHGKRRIRAAAVLECQMPDAVVGPDGHVKHRPSEWKSAARTDDTGTIGAEGNP